FGVSGVCAVIECGVFWDPSAASDAERAARHGAGVALTLADTIFGEAVAAELSGSIRQRFLTAAAGIVGGCRTPFYNALRLSAVPARQSVVLRPSCRQLEEAW